jgi:hypothetical protein
MKKQNLILLSVLGLLPMTMAAQNWEIGASGGGSFYTSSDVVKGNSSVQASFSPGFTAGFILGQDMGRYWGGEIRYDFQRNDAKLDGNGGKATFGAQSHTIHYDFLLHFKPSGEKVRPYISFGAGVKQFRGTGPEVVSQPLSEFALLTLTTDTTPVAVVGFGVKVKAGKKSSVRVEMKDFISPVPSKVFAPNRGASVSGWIHNFVPTVGVTYVF